MLNDLGAVGTDGEEAAPRLDDGFVRFLDIGQRCSVGRRRLGHRCQHPRRRGPYDFVAKSLHGFGRLDNAATGRKLNGVAVAVETLSPGA